MKKTPSPTTKRRRRHPAPPGRARAEPAAFPIVGIGASAGGLEAFSQLLHHLPADTGLAFVLVQHLDPAHESALTDLLARTTTMPVCEVTNNLIVKPNHVYVIPPNADLALNGGQLRLLPRHQTAGAPRAIDFFLQSLAQDRHDQAIGVILSGTASDGTLGLEAIKAECGITFAQDESAKYDSMPRSAIAAGSVDFVLSPENIARELARIASHPCVKGGRLLSSANSAASQSAQAESAFPGQLAFSSAEPGRGRPAAEEPDFKKVLLLLRSHSGVDFSLYKPSTIERRIFRRMVLNKSETLAAYASSLRGNDNELDALYADVLISVTSFFRNPEAFAALKRRAFPRLLQPPREGALRVWVPGCSTGQEAYSLAMAYLEFCEHHSRAPKLQVFATDLNEALLDKARRGLYAKNLLLEVSPERLHRFFVEEQGGYRVSKSLRGLCVFARHNLLNDPPFSHMDLVSCRNLLIYIQPALQQRILPAFHYALNPGGLLFLGASESIGPFTDLFDAVDKKLKIFARKPGTTPELRLPIARAHRADRNENAPARPLPLRTPALEPNAQREADRLTVARFAPPGVLVNADLQIVQFRGATGAYLQPPTGKPSFDLLKMARGDLRPPLRAALRKAARQGQVVRAENVRLTQDGGERAVNLEIVPLKNLKERCYLVLFAEADQKGTGPRPVCPGGLPGEPPGPQRQRAGSGPAPAGSIPAPPPGENLRAGRRRVAALERELAETRDYLQSFQEQYEAANEELQSANEEVTSANEELQSTNEELETSKEELESSNEELTTVNEEMANRNQELNRLNSDLNNLHAGINTPILLLGHDLTIRRFTPPAEKLFNLAAADVGRPLGAIKHRLDFPGLEQFMAEIIDTVSVREREVQDRDGNWYVLRARPYVTLDKKVDGAVLLLVDINRLKQHEQKIGEARDFARAIIDAVPPLLILDPDLRVQTANESFYRAFGVNPAQTEGRLIFDLGNGQWNTPALRQVLEEILPQERSLHDFEVTHHFERLGQRTMLLNARQVGRGQTIILSFLDITERQRAEAAMRQAQEVLARQASELEATVNERTASLRETVRELEAFSYSMVHDMRAPLRAMSGFAQMLGESYGSRLDEAGRQMLERITTSAARLDQLIQDVLAYTHVLRDKAPLTPVDLDELMRELLATCPNWALPHADVRLLSPLPAVLGHKALLAQCLTNLVGNAVKFVAPGVQPCIRIWGEARGRHVRLNVQDNGIGIVPEHRHRVFGMFERIHPASEYEGTGIGLTIVRRAAERLGGQAGFDSEPGKGSTFWFEVPRAEQP